jgi:hypothetical protein
MTGMIQEFLGKGLHRLSIDTELCQVSILGQVECRYRLALGNNVGT